MPKIIFRSIMFGIFFTGLMTLNAAITGLTFDTFSVATTMTSFVAALIAIELLMTEN
jgi:hypothetical protein